MLSLFLSDNLNESVLLTAITYLLTKYLYLFGEIMAISQGKSIRSPSGARNKSNRGKRKSQLGREPAEKIKKNQNSWRKRKTQISYC